MEEIEVLDTRDIIRERFSHMTCTGPVGNGSPMCYPKGWDSIIWDLLNEINVLMKKYNTDRHVINIVDIKEKFGTLRFYYDSSGSEEFYNAVDEAVNWAEKMSAVTCDKCGSKGETRDDNSWYVTLCDKHWEERKKWSAQWRTKLTNPKTS